jgi:hypothetical protein
MSRTANSLRQVDSGVPGPPALFFLFESQLPGDRHSSLGECTRLGEQEPSKQGRSSFAKKSQRVKLSLGLSHTRGTLPTQAVSFVSPRLARAPSDCPNGERVVRFVEDACGGGEVGWNKPSNGFWGVVHWPHRRLKA